MVTTQESPDLTPDLQIPAEQWLRLGQSPSRTATEGRPQGKSRSAGGCTSTKRRAQWAGSAQNLRQATRCSTRQGARESAGSQALGGRASLSVRPARSPPAVSQQPVPPPRCTTAVRPPPSRGRGAPLSSCSPSTRLWRCCCSCRLWRISAAPSI